MVKLKDANIQPASEADFLELKDLLDTANDHWEARWGRRQWNDMDRVYGQFRQLIKDGRCFVVRNQAGVITSTISLGTESDYWGEAGHDGKALYIFKLIRHPELSAAGDGQVLLAFAAREAIKEQKTFLRCDTATDIEHLITYYEKLGFAKTGSFTYPTTGAAGVLLEAEAATLNNKLADRMEQDEV